MVVTYLLLTVSGMNANVLLLTDENHSEILEACQLLQIIFFYGSSNFIISSFSICILSMVLGFDIIMGDNWVM